jgi:hypothetical protein
MIKASQIIVKILEAGEAQEPYLILKGPPFIQKIAKNLSEFLPYVKVSVLDYRGTRGFDVNAGDIYIPSRWDSQKIGHAITVPGHEKATGISIFISPEEQWVIFQEITSKRSGIGTKMVDAVISEVPKDWLLQIHHDFSGGFWEAIKRKYSDWGWNLENSFSSGRGENVYRLRGDRERKIIELRVINISGKDLRQQFEMPFDTPADFHAVEDEVGQEVEKTDSYQVDPRQWKEVTFKSEY